MYVRKTEITWRYCFVTFVTILLTFSQVSLPSSFSFLPPSLPSFPPSFFSSLPPPLPLSSYPSPLPPPSSLSLSFSLFPFAIISSIRTNILYPSPCKHSQSFLLDEVEREILGQKCIKGVASF